MMASMNINADQLMSSVNTGFQPVNSAIGTLSNELRNNSRTQWPVVSAALSVGVTILVGLGFMALQPIKNNTARLENAFVRLSEASVSQKEMEWRTARGQEDRARSETAINDLRNSQVSRLELTRVFMGYDQQFGDVQRQVDELKQVQGGIYGARDIIMDLKENQQRLERELGRLVGINGRPGER